METVSARLDTEVFVDCPQCGELIDLLDEHDTDGYNHNDCGEVLIQACPDDCWIDEHKNFSVDEVTCSECKTTFNVAGLEW